MGSKILITGSSGFVGTNFITMSPELEISEVDLLTQKVDEIDFTGVDAVLHLAALVHQMKGAPDDQYFKINCDLAFKTALQAKSKGVKHFILMSTAKVYGDSTTNKESWNEKSECHPKDTYGKSKLKGEKLIQSLEDENFAVAIVRSPLVFGSGVKANMFNLIMLIDKLPVLPFGGIKNERSMVYIGNLVALLKKIILKNANGIFIAGNDSPVSTTDLVNQICRSLQKERIIFTLPAYLLKIAEFLKPSFVHRLTESLVLDNSETNRILNFNPPFTFEQGINEMVTWYQKSQQKH